MSIFQGTIKSRVMKSINARILQAEKDYNDECDAIDAKAEKDKGVAADKQVENILGKIL